jgi:hypothetical protein
MGKIVFNNYNFIWVKSRGQIFIKIGNLKLTYYN